MPSHFEQRIAYGRSVRSRAECLLEAHGSAAIALVEDAAQEPGLPDADRCFWEAVAARLARQIEHRPAWPAR